MQDKGSQLPLKDSGSCWVFTNAVDVIQNKCGTSVPLCTCRNLTETSKCCLACSSRIAASCLSCSRLCWVLTGKGVGATVFHRDCRVTLWDLNKMQDTCLTWRQETMISHLDRGLHVAQQLLAFKTVLYPAHFLMFEQWQLVISETIQCAQTLYSWFVMLYVLVITVLITHSSETTMSLELLCYISIYSV